MTPRDGAGELLPDGGLAVERRAGAGSSSMAVVPGLRRPSSAKTWVKGMARPSGPVVTRCAISPGQAVVPAADLAVADDGAAEAFAEVEVGEIGECAGSGVGLLGAGGPVHVVVGLDGAVDEGREDVGGGELADQERRVGQVDESPGAAVDGIGGADDGEVDAPRRHRGRRAQRLGDVRPGRWVGGAAARPAVTVRP